MNAEGYLLRVTGVKGGIRRTPAQRNPAIHQEVYGDATGYCPSAVLVGSDSRKLDEQVRRAVGLGFDSRGTVLHFGYIDVPVPTQGTIAAICYTVNRASNIVPYSLE